MVALSEPMSRAEFAGLTSSAEACVRVRRFAAEAGRLVRRDRRAPSLHVGGRLDDNVVAVDPDAGLRRRRAEQGEIRIDKPLTDRFTLLIKHNALFAALLPQLAKTFACVALVRNPLAALASWQTVDLPVNRGRIPAGEQFDRGLREALRHATDVLARQTVVLDWFFTQYAENLPPERIVRYEDLISTGGGALFRVLGHPSATSQPLTSRNDHAVYRRADIAGLLAALVDAGGAWTRFYSRTDCESAAEMLASRCRVARSP